MGGTLGPKSGYPGSRVKGMTLEEWDGYAGDKLGAVPPFEAQSLPEGLNLENWQSSPHLHWTFQHVADFLPTATISRGPGPVATLRHAATSLASLPLLGRGGSRTVGDVMDETHTDGWMVLHEGQVLAERYYGEATASSSHLLMSVSKSLVGAVVGALVDAGTIDPERTAESYIPELAGAGYAGASVRDLLDMRSGIVFSEEYLNPNAEVRLLEEAIGWAPRRNHTVPDTMYGFLASLRQEGEHGGPFDYRSSECDMLGWICEAATGEKMPELMSRVLWSRIGAEEDATIGVDSEGSGMFDGGINATLRDMARFGTLFLNEGTSLTGEQVLSPAWVADTLDGGADSRAAFAESPGDNRMPGGMYRNQCWFPYPGNDVMLCLGIHGQMIYVNRPAGIIAAKLSSWPYPQDAEKLFSTIRAFDAISGQYGYRPVAQV